jgi:hypothetical protein
MRKIISLITCLSGTALVILYTFNPLLSKLGIVMIICSIVAAMREGEVGVKKKFPSIDSEKAFSGEFEGSREVYLLSGYQQGTLTDIELEELKKWIDENPENAELFDIMTKDDKDQC